MRVVIVTDDADRRSRLRQYLYTRGYEVSIPLDQPAVVSMVKEIAPEAIVLDLFVAKPSATEILRALRNDGYAGKVIALAGQSITATLAACSRIGIDSVVGGIQVTGGPFDPGCVEVAIRTSLQREIVQHPHDLWVLPRTE